jgi:hypothetical protein
MKFSIQVCAVLSVFWQSLIFAFEFVDDCSNLGGPIFAEKNGWVRIGCKTNERFGYCTLTRLNPSLTCEIVIHGTTPSVKACNENKRIEFTGNPENKYCEFLIENLQQEGKSL